MYRFFDAITEPLLEALKPKVVIEIGVDRGHQTELVAPWCAENYATLHCVDPLPKFDTDEWAKRWPGSIEFHLDLSLNALPGIPPSEMVLVDGDHNWYTVFHELKALDDIARTTKRSFPLVLLHDIGWPYGRRDLYYNPATIPSAFRHAHRRGGLALDQEEVSETGYNDHLENAERSGTPQNGVLTAVEDFLQESSTALDFLQFDGIHGLGIIVDPRTDASVLRLIRDDIASLSGQGRLLETVERDRLERLGMISRFQRSVAKHERTSAELRTRNTELKLSSQDHALRAAELEAQVKDLAAAAEASERQRREQAAVAASLRQELAHARAELRGSFEREQVTRQEADRARREVRRLRQRRSVRLALATAELVGPAVGVARRSLRREKPAKTNAAPPQAPPTTTSEFHNHLAALKQGAVPEQFLEDMARSEKGMAKHAATIADGPLVSIIMPTRNRAAVIASAIQSVKDQNYTNWELLVMDDASDDDTADVIARFGDPRIAYRRLPRGGAAAARNAGLAASRGGLIAYLDSDNIWHPKFLAIMVHALGANGGHHSAYSRYIDIRVEGETLRLKRYRRKAFDYDELADRNYIDLNAFVHRRWMYDRLGGFNQELVRQQDWDLILKFTFLRDPVFVDKLLMLYRRNQAWAQITSVHSEDQTAPGIVRNAVDGYYTSGVPHRRNDKAPSVSIISWDTCRNHFSKAYNLAESFTDPARVQLVGFRFFGDEIFPPYEKAKPAFPCAFFNGGSFPTWGADLARAVAATTGDVVYAVKPRLPSLGVALLANYHFGKPIVLEINDLESVVTTPEAGQAPGSVALSDTDPADPDLLNPYGALWTGLMEGLAHRVPVRTTHNHVLDKYFGGGAYSIRNLKDENWFDPSRYDREEARRSLGFSPDERVILFGGMVRRHKGVFELVELIKKAGPRYRLLVVGSRETPDQARLRTSEPERVVITSPVDRNEMAKLNLASDAVILWLDPKVPASHYQMPYKLTDALAMRVPVIANDIGGIGLLGRQGFLRLADAGDPTSLLAALSYLESEPEATAKMVDRGRRLYLRQFSYAAVRPTLEHVLSEAALAPGRLDVAAEFADFFARFRESTGAGLGVRRG